MKRIMLVCSAGMSTSLLVGKIKEKVVERGLDIDVIGVSQLEVSNYPGAVEVLLLGPQVRYLLTEMEELMKNKQTVVAVIDSVSYGMLDGKAVLDQAMKLMD